MPPEPRASSRSLLDVVEPMGMETMVYFIVDGVEVCGRVNPGRRRNAGRADAAVSPTSTTCT